jgi:serine/threonine protein kinase
VGWLQSLFGGKKKSNLPRIDVNKRFDLLGRTGQGSMSKVWRARDRNLGRVVCLKILDKVKTAKFDSRFPGLQRPMEGAICQALRHKNVVQTFEYGLTFQGEQYVVMELIDGMGLNFLIETRNAGLNGKRINYLLQITDAVEYIHQQGYLHRDLCPRNIMVTQEGVVKLIDFGLALPYRPEFCRPGNRTGTPDYLAPELIKRVTTDSRVDMFSLGVTAYETLTNGLPWEKARGSLEVLQKHINVAGRDPRELKPDLEEVTARFLIKAIDRDPKERYQNPVEFREALKALPKKY